MTKSTTSYHPLPPDPPPQYVVVLPYHRPPTSTTTLILRSCRRYSLPILLFLLLTSAVFLLFPSDPQLTVIRVNIDHLQFHTFPISLDTTLDLTVKLFNRNFYSINYDYLNVSIAYRGKELGFVSSDEGRVKARATSYVDARLELVGVEFFDDVVPLIADLAKGVVTFDTVTQIGGQLGLYLFQIPLKAKVACEIVIDIHNQTINHQNCYPE